MCSLSRLSKSTAYGGQAMHLEGGVWFIQSVGEESFQKSNTRRKKEEEVHIKMCFKQILCFFEQV
jgi:hypothetical protein